MKKKFRLGEKFTPKKIEGSSQIKEVGYDKSESKLYIVFSNDSIYHYSPVEEKRFQGLVDAPSAGSYFHKHIKNNKSIICNKLNL